METNNQKMREALEYASRVLAKWRQDAPFSAWNEYGEAIDKCRAALAAPARNCDRFKTKEEAALAYAEECNAFIPQSILWQIGEWLDWLFYEAKKGATDADK